MLAIKWPRRALALLILVVLLACVEVLVDDVGLSSQISPVSCWADFFWTGSLMRVHHYKKTANELRKHYRDTWRIENLSSSALRNYLGPPPPIDPQNSWNDCPDDTAKVRFGKYLTLVNNISWSQRDCSPAPSVCFPLGHVDGHPCRKHFAVVEVVMKNEPLPYVQEFIEHHLAVGFSHIYMGIDHVGDAYDEYAASLKPYIDCGLLTISSCHGQTVGHIQQLEYANETFWMARVDIDEFIVPRHPYDSVVPLLLPLVGRFGEVPLQMKLGRTEFGSSGRTFAPPGIPMVVLYTRRNGVPKSVKSIFQTDGLLLAPRLFNISQNPHAVLGTIVECMDMHWVFLFYWAVICWPQTPKIYWPPHVHENDHVVPRIPTPYARSIWKLAAL